MSFDRSSRFFALSALVILLGTNLLVARAGSQEQPIKAASTKARHLAKKRPWKKRPKISAPNRVQSTGNENVSVRENPAESKNAGPSPAPNPVVSPSPSPNSTATPCPSPLQVKETSVQSVKISPNGIELSGFPWWVNIIVLVGAGIFFVASLWFARSNLKDASPRGFWITASVAGIVLILILGILLWHDRSQAVLDIHDKVEKAKQESRGELPPAPPVAPSDLTASPVSNSQVNLSWADNSDSEQGFKIERKLGAEGTYAPLVILGPNATSYSDVGLAPETNATYRIKAFNASGGSQYSNEANGTTLATTVKSNDNTWSSPATWLWYVILPVSAMVIVLCTFLAYLSFRYLRMRERRLYEEMRMRKY
jgi:hypothetical protein